MSEYIVKTKFSSEIIEQSLCFDHDLVSQATTKVIKLQEEGVKDALKRLGYLSPEQAKRLTVQVEELKESLEKLTARGVEYLNSEDIDNDEDRATIESNFNDQILESRKLLTRIGEENGQQIQTKPKG